MSEEVMPAQTKNSTFTMTITLEILQKLCLILKSYQISFRPIGKLIKIIHKFHAILMILG